MFKWKKKLNTFHLPVCKCNTAAQKPSYALKLHIFKTKLIYHALVCKYVIGLNYTKQFQKRKLS